VVLVKREVEMEVTELVQLQQMLQLIQVQEEVVAATMVQRHQAVLAVQV
jgi:hypothetical protein